MPSDSRTPKPRHSNHPGIQLAVMMMFSSAAGWGQEFSPHIGYVYPAGGQRGTTVDVTFGGQYLVGVSGAHVSGGGIQAVVLPSDPLLTGKQAAEARGRLRELREKKDAAARVEIRKLSARLAIHERSKITPAIGEKVTVRLTIAANALPGTREVRLATATGLTNPLRFQIGELPECREANAGGNEDWVKIQKSINDPDSRVKTGRNDAPPMAVTPPVIINGQILPGEADHFRFQAKRGQKMMISVSAREILPYLADTVPGWLQATVSLLDPKGKELIADNDVQMLPDPRLRYDMPEDGEYVLEIRDSLYRGREDFVYRILIGESSSQASAAVNRRADNPVGGGMPEMIEMEPNTGTDHAQSVSLPIMINGAIGEPGDIDIFRLEGKAGERLVAEVHARRMDSPLDSVLILTDAAGKRIGFNDDHEDKGSGLNTHHADSYLAATLPATGVYFIHLGDTQQNGGNGYVYRLRISRPQPDFALRIVPSTINLRANATRPVTVYALRSDGFTGEIALTLKDATSGFQLAGGKVPVTQDKVQCTLTAPASPTQKPINLMMEGHAVIGGKAVVHPVVPAEEMTQAFSYRHLVTTDDLLVAVTNNFAPNGPARAPNANPLRIPSGGTALALFSTPHYSPFDVNQIRLVNPPDGITIKSTTSSKGRFEILVAADAAKVKPGLTGNLIAGFVAKDPTPPGAPKINPKRVPLGSLPAIPFEIIDNSTP